MEEFGPPPPRGGGAVAALLLIGTRYSSPLNRYTSGGSLFLDHSGSLLVDHSHKANFD